MIQNAQALAVKTARARGQQSPSQNNDYPVLTPATAAPQRTNPTAEDQFLDAVRQRIGALGWSLQDVDERAGLPDRYAGKILRPHSSGRSAKWITWESVLGALWPDGFKITITGLQAPDRADGGRP